MASETASATNIRESALGLTILNLNTAETKTETGDCVTEYCINNSLAHRGMMNELRFLRFVHDLYDSCEGRSKRYCWPSTRYDSRHGWYIVVFFIYHQAPSTKRFEFDSGADFFKLE